MSKQKNLIAVLFIALMSVALAACNARFWPEIQSVKAIIR